MDDLEHVGSGVMSYPAVSCRQNVERRGRLCIGGLQPQQTPPSFHGIGPLVSRLPLSYRGPWERLLNLWKWGTIISRGTRRERVKLHGKFIPGARNGELVRHAVSAIKRRAPADFDEHRLHASDSRYPHYRTPQHTSN